MHGIIAADTLAIHIVSASVRWGVHAGGGGCVGSRVASVGVYACPLLEHMFLDGPLDGPLLVAVTP